MSRGYGYVQRLVLEALDERLDAPDPWVDVLTIAERLEVTAPSGNARRSVRRALGLLAADGVVELASDPASQARDRPPMYGRIASARLDDASTRLERRARSRALRLGLVPPVAHRRDDHTTKEQTCPGDPLVPFSSQPASQRSR